MKFIDKGGAGVTELLGDRRLKDIQNVKTEDFKFA